MMKQINVESKSENQQAQSLFKIPIILFLFSLVEAIACTNVCYDVTSHPNHHLVNHPSCGRGHGDDGDALSNRILWANQTLLGAHPWMALIVSRTDSKSIPNVGIVSNKICAGTLINERYIISVSSCFTSPLDVSVEPRVRVWLRVYQRTRLDIINCDPKVCIPAPLAKDAEQVLVHPRYDFTKRQGAHDIALIRLREKVHFEDYLKPICLPLTCEMRTLDFERTITTMLGWDHKGKIRTGLDMGTLESSKMLGVSKKSCQEHVEDLGLKIEDSQVCAMWVGNRSACTEDLGGPLLAEFKEDGSRMYQVGIISVVLCDLEDSPFDRPNVFTRVGDYIPYILHNIQS